MVRAGEEITKMAWSKSFVLSKFVAWFVLAKGWHPDLGKTWEHIHAGTILDICGIRERLLSALRLVPEINCIPIWMRIGDGFVLGHLWN